MKILPPPPIAGLDELLDVVLHPEKLVARLKQMQEMRDAIKTSLDTYATKDKADDYLGLATAKRAEAQHALADANETLEDVHKEVAALRATQAREQSEWQVERQAQQQELAAREKACQDQAAALDAQSRALTVRDGDVTSLLDATTKRKAQLDAEYDKMMKRKALLSEIN